MYNYALVPVELSLLCRLNHYGLDKIKQINNSNKYFFYFFTRSLSLSPTTAYQNN